MHKVAIVGMGSDSDRAPFDDPSFECWGMNHQYLYMPPGEWQWDRWFELHEPWQIRQEREARLAWLAEDHGVPVYARRRYEEWPASRPLPVAALSSIGPRGFYHAGTFDWMVAMAIYENASHIEIHGLDSLEIEGGEPRSARACLEYWCGYAEALGIPVEVFPGGAVLRNYERDGGQYPWDKDIYGETRPPGIWHTVRDLLAGNEDEELDEDAEAAIASWADAEIAWSNDYVYYRVERDGE